MSYNITIDDRALKKALDRAERDLPKSIEKAVNNTAIKSLSKVKTELPKRSGNLRRSYSSQKVTGDKFARRLVSATPKIADTLEQGRGPRTIKPKRGRFLTIPMNDSVLIPSKARIKKLGKKQFQSAVKNGDIVLAKQVSQPRWAGKKTLSKRVLPYTDRTLKRELQVQIGRAL